MKDKARQMLSIFLISYGLNAVWENLHSVLYAAYKGGQITEFILLRAAVADATIISLIALPFVYIKRLQKYAFLIIPLAVTASILNEYYGLGTSRWAYKPIMPIIPVLNVGLTPTIQLGLLGYISYKISQKLIHIKTS